MVISRPTDPCHCPDAVATSSAMQAHSAARKARMAMTATSARFSAEWTGTSGAWRFSFALKPGSGATSSAEPDGTGIVRAIPRLLIDVQETVADHEPAGFDLIHQGEIVRRDQNGGAEPVELDEEAQEPAREGGGGGGCRPWAGSEGWR